MTDEDLSPSQIDELAGSLRELKNHLESTLALAKASSQPVELDQAAVGRVSRGDALQQQQMALANRRNSERRLAQVKSALAAVESGDYGCCRECEEPIGYKRLRSRPETPFCFECQGRRERR